MNPTSTAFDAAMLTRAAELAARGRGAVEPNPYVGCVVVKNGRIVSEGAHLRYGGPHAEAVALKRAGAAARGSTLYATLEPCSHHGKTPPCEAMILRCGVKRIVVGAREKHERAAGSIANLRAAGRDVTVLTHEASTRLAVPFFEFLEARRPFVVLKWAMTLDGRIATAGGDSKYITAEAARRRVHRERARCDGILVGAGTVLADDPDLTPRLVRGPAPLRIVLDRRLRTPVASQVVQTAADVPTVVVTTRDAPARRAAALERRGVELIRLRGKGSLSAALRAVRERGVGRLLVEGGAEIHGAFWREGAVDLVQTFVAPRVLGGRDAMGPVGGDGPKTMAAAKALVGVRTRRFGADFAIEGEPTATSWGVRAGFSP